MIDVLRTQSLSLAAQEEVERMILAGELRAGDRVNENLLAAKLGISRGPIREACRALISAGLLHAHVNRGVFVRKLSVKDAVDIYDIRASLEGLACNLLAERISSTVLAQLRALVEQMAEAAKQGDRLAYAPLNYQFHDIIFTNCGSGRLAALYRDLSKELSLFRRTSQARPGALNAGVSEHRAVIDALAARDPNGAERAMRDHVQRAKRRLLAAADVNELPLVKTPKAADAEAGIHEGGDDD